MVEIWFFHFPKLKLQKVRQHPVFLGFWLDWIYWLRFGWRVPRVVDCTPNLFSGGSLHIEINPDFSFNIEVCIYMMQGPHTWRISSPKSWLQEFTLSQAPSSSLNRFLFQIRKMRVSRKMFMLGPVFKMFLYDASKNCWVSFFLEIRSQQCISGRCGKNRLNSKSTKLGHKCN